MQNKYLAMTPPMGWNSWNTFTWNINEELICGAADALAQNIGRLAELKEQTNAD